MASIAGMEGVSLGRDSYLVDDAWRSTGAAFERVRFSDPDPGSFDPPGVAR